jgi:hypothetical protein
MDDYYNFILILYFGFLIIYLIHPEPSLFYRNKKLYDCKNNNEKIYIKK